MGEDVVMRMRLPRYMNPYLVSYNSLSYIDILVKFQFFNMLLFEIAIKISKIAHDLNG
jgi:hypothetical protein